MCLSSFPHGNLRLQFHVSEVEGLLKFLKTFFVIGRKTFPQNTLRLEHDHAGSARAVLARLSVGRSGSAAPCLTVADGDDHAAVPDARVVVLEARLVVRRVRRVDRVRAARLACNVNHPLTAECAKTQRQMSCKSTAVTCTHCSRPHQRTRQSVVFRFSPARQEVRRPSGSSGNDTNQPRSHEELGSTPGQ